MAGVEIKCKDLSIKEKLSIIESYDKLPKMSQYSVPVSGGYFIRAHEHVNPQRNVVIFF